MAIVKPQVLVYQEYSIVPNALTEPLRAHVSGANAILHRYDTPDEKALISLGEYDPDVDTCYSWPERSAGGIVDTTSVKLYIDDALLKYFDSQTQDPGTITPVSGRNNWIRASNMSFTANGTSYPRSSYLYDRDVAIGDKVRVWGSNQAGTDTDELWSYVAGFAADETSSEYGEPTAATTNSEASTSGGTCTSSTSADSSDWNVATSGISETGYTDPPYDGLADGYVSEDYVVTVIEAPTKTLVDGSWYRYGDNGKVSVSSASGTDNVSEAPIFVSTQTASSITVEIPVGTRGGWIKFLSIAPDKPTLDVGTVLTVTGISQDFEVPSIAASGDYSGAVDDTYIVEVSKGGLWADSPQVSVTTVKGLDSSGPTVVTASTLSDIPLGTNGLTFRFIEAGQYISDSVSSYGSQDSDALLGLSYGDKWYVTVNAATDGAYTTLKLRDDLPEVLQDSADLEVQLFMEKDILVPENQEPNPPNVNYTLEATQICVESGIQIYDSSWTSNGVNVAIPVSGGTLYSEYNEWVSTVADDVYFASSTEDLDDIPGQLDPANELKWGVYKALQNSNGVSVGYTAVANPLSNDSWQDVLDRVDGRVDVYNLVPMTKDTTIKGLYQGLVESNSGAEQGAWKAAFFSLNSSATKMIVGKSTAADQLLNPTSEDGEVVLATITDDTTATGSQYTMVSVPENNAGFLTYGVKAGDKVRYLYTVDGFGQASYFEYTVDQVLSENSLILTSGLAAPITVPQKMEVWRTLSTGELITDLKSEAGGYGDKRICMVWPDVVGSGGITQAGYFLCAALAGLVSGVAPQQGLTRVSVSGFDDLSRSYKLFSETEMTDLSNGGVWIVTEDGDGSVYTRHALTTDVSSTNLQEEMIRRNVDSISYVFLNRLEPYIGRTNVTPSMLRKLRYETEAAISYLRNSGYTSELGGQLIDASIETLRVHPLLADRVEIVLDLEVPYPLNNIELHLVV